MKNGNSKTRHWFNLVVLFICIFPLLGIIFYQQKKITTLTDKAFCYKGEYFNGSCMGVVDINNDGKEEIVYQPKSASWHNGTFILKEKMDGEGFFELFCKNCVFSSYATYVELRDVNGDNLIDVIVPMVMDDNLMFRFKVYYFEDNDFVLKESYDLPDNGDDGRRKSEELLEKYRSPLSRG